jgi:hypothetical protein
VYDALTIYSWVSPAKASHASAKNAVFHLSNLFKFAVLLLTTLNNNPKLIEHVKDFSLIFQQPARLQSEKKLTYNMITTIRFKIPV